MNRLMVLMGFLLIFTVGQAWGAIPAACNGLFNKTVTGAENILNSPNEAQANTWRRCNAILADKQYAKQKAIRAKREAWVKAQNQNP